MRLAACLKLSILIKIFAFSGRTGWKAKLIFVKILLIAKEKLRHCIGLDHKESLSKFHKNEKYILLIN